MTKKIIPLLLFILSGIMMNIQAQTDDKDLYWILEDFNGFEHSPDGWIVEETHYQTYPHQINLSTVYANFEAPVGCARGDASLRIRGWMENGSASFTVPNASTVNISVTGKKIENDRSIIIYRNGEEIKRYDNIGKNTCIDFVDPVNTDQEITYKVTAGNPESTDPIVLYGIKVLKYGVEIAPEPEPEYANYWIYEDFSSAPIMEDYWDYFDLQTMPNDLPFAISNANTEFGEGCTQGTRVLRLSGREGAAGLLEFSIPDAKKVTIGVSGKSTTADRSILIYRNNELVATLSDLDRTVCKEFVDEVNSSEWLNYRIVGGDNDFKPVAVNYVYAEKYNSTGLCKPIRKNPMVYPNPASDIIHFDNNVEKVEVLDMNGRLVHSDYNTKATDISHLQKGFYLIKISDDSNSFAQKLIKI